MPFNTITVAAAATPTFINTAISHYLSRKPFKDTPKAHLSYHQGVALIKRFLEYASHHTVEQVQSFTAQYVPHPAWVHCEDIVIPQECLDKAAEYMIDELGPGGVEKVGGKRWWTWRERDLEAEWVEMRKDKKHREKYPHEAKRTMFYVHGGAYFFGSVDEHRYQLQPHARKLKARVFAPRYRLAPQYPFPCGIYDVLASYLYLLTEQPPETIIIAGDSAGGGMVLSLLVILRNQGIPMPAGGVLISPWVDLCHSFPSVIGDNSNDYIPAHGFLQKPSPAWPPPTSTDLSPSPPSAPTKLAALGYTATQSSTTEPATTPIKPTLNAQINIDGTLVTITDQIQMYTTNELVSHPLVSPVTQSTLGGLCPLLILTGGGEVLRDEQIYIAHKAADPTAYPTWEGHIDEDETGRQRDAVAKYPGTKVLLQVFDGCCHVTTTLSFTKPAKMMFHSIALFSARCLSEASRQEIIVSDNGSLSISPSSSSSPSPSSPSSSSSSSSEGESQGGGRKANAQSIVSATLPPFPPENIIRQRIDRKGNILPLEPASELPGCNLKPHEIGVVKPEPVKRWMEAKQLWDTKFAKAKREVQKRRAKEIAQGYACEYPDERPPPSALIGRRIKSGESKWWKWGEEERVENAPNKKEMGWGLRIWSTWGYRHDERTMARKQAAKTGAVRVKSKANKPGEKEVKEDIDKKGGKDESEVKSEKIADTSTPLRQESGNEVKESPEVEVSDKKAVAADNEIRE